MKRVLIITHDFPPALNVSSRRPFGLAKYLPRFGWEPVVLTTGHPERRPQDHPGLTVLAPPAGPKIDSLPAKSFRELESPWKARAKRLLYYPDYAYSTWREDAITRFLAAAEDKPIAAIISTARPFTAHIIAASLKERFGVPWIADFRDLWPHYRFFLDEEYFRSLGSLRDRTLLRRTLAATDAFTTIGQVLAEGLKRRFPNRPVLAIHNGYDPVEFAHPASPGKDVFLITFTGHVREDMTGPADIFPALHALLSRGEMDRDRVRLKIFGEVPRRVQEAAQRYGLQDIVEVSARVAREEVVRCQTRSHLLLLSTALQPDNQGTIGGKIFEYLAAGRPILALAQVGCDGFEVEKIIAETKSGKYARSPEEIETVLADAYRRFQDTGAVPYDGLSEKIWVYGYDRMAQAFGGLLDRLTAPSPAAFLQAHVTELYPSAASPAGAEVLEQRRRPFSDIFRVGLRVSDAVKVVYAKRSKESVKEFETLKRLRRSGVSVPAPLAVFPDQGLLVTEEYKGESLLTAIISGARWAPAAGALDSLQRHSEDCGRWLRNFQTVTRHGPSGGCSRVLFQKSLTRHSQRASVLGLSNRLKAQIATYAAAHTAMPNIPLTDRHGDFAPWNILVGGDALTVLDFDTVSPGCPYEDIADFLTVLEGEKSVLGMSAPALTGLQEAFRNGYGRGEIASGHLTLHLIKSALRWIPRTGYETLSDQGPFDRMYASFRKRRQIRYYLSLLEGLTA